MKSIEKKISTFTLAALALVAISACQRPRIVHGSEISVSGAITLQENDIQVGELCVFVNTREITPGKKERVKESSMEKCLENVVVQDGMIDETIEITLQSSYEEFEVVSLEDIFFVTQENQQKLDSDFKLNKVYEAEVVSANSQGKDHVAELEFEFVKTQPVSLLAEIVAGCDALYGQNVESCVAWKIAPDVAKACAKATSNSEYELDCIEQSARHQRTYRPLHWNMY